MSVLRNLTRRRPTAVATKDVQPRVPLVGRGFRTSTSSILGNNDPEQQMEMFGRSGTLFATVTLNASSFSTVTWRLFRSTDGRGRISGPDPRKEVTTHAALDMWNKPNPWMSGQLFRESYQQHLELTGQAFWVISYVGSIPAAMWPIRPDRMQPVPDVDKFIAGWVYTGPNGETVPLTNKEVVWLRQPAPLNIYGGMGAVEPLMPDIEAARFVSDWNRNFFKNSANPGGYVQFPERLSDETFDELTERWAEQHQGVQRAHRVAFLEMGATFQSSDLSMEDMQFVELRQDGRNIIYEANGTSKSLLGVTEDVNRANAEANEYVFAKYRQVVKLDRTRDALNYQFLQLFGGTGGGLNFDYDNPIPNDWQADAQTTKANADAAVGLIGAGFDPVGTLEAMSLPAIKHTGVIPSMVMPPTAQPAQTYEPAATEDRKVPAIRAKAERVRNDDTQQSQQQQTQVGQQWAAALAALVAAYTLRILATQRVSLLADIRRILTGGDITDLGDLSVETAAAGDLIFEHERDLSTQAANTVVQEASAQGVQLDPVAADQTAMRQIADVSAALMGRDLAASAGGEAARLAGPDVDVDGVVRSVQTFLEGLSSAPVETQLGSCLTRAQNLARMATIKAGPAADLTASEVDDRGTCGPCRDIDGTNFGVTSDASTWDRAYSEYPLGQYTGCLGRDRCRGTLTAMWHAQEGQEAA